MTGLTERAITPPREGLMRMSAFVLRDAGDGGGDGNTLDGYAAVFNRQTVIDSWEGRFKEQIRPGAMKKSFREKPPVIQFDHGKHPMIGSIPIARVESITEDSHPTLAPDGGAHIIGRLHDNWLIQPVREAIASGSIDGMSFRFSVIREEWHRPDGRKVTNASELADLLTRSWRDNLPDDELLVRSLLELRVPELGPVVFPAYTDTSVGVRSQTVTIDLGRLHDPEQRSILARAVLLADQASAETAAMPDSSHIDFRSDETDAADSLPQATDGSAGEHRQYDDPPRSTPETGAGEHRSITRLDVRHFSAQARSALHTIRDQKGRYSNV